MEELNLVKVNGIYELAYIGKTDSTSNFDCFNTQIIPWVDEKLCCRCKKIITREEVEKVECPITTIENNDIDLNNLADESVNEEAIKMFEIFYSRLNRDDAGSFFSINKWMIPTVFRIIKKLFCRISIGSSTLLRLTVSNANRSLYSTKWADLINELGKFNVLIIRKVQKNGFTVSLNFEN